MAYYNCIDDLAKRLSDAVDEVLSCAEAYDGEGPYRVLIDDLTDEHGFDKQYIPLLNEMIKERVPDYDLDLFDDEIMLYRKSIPTLDLPFTKTRTMQLLNKALDWIGEMENGSELYDTLKNVIGMTDSEISAARFDMLKEYFEKPEPDTQTPDIDPDADAPEFAARMRKIPGIDEVMLAAWIQHAYDMAVINEEAGVPREDAREASLNEFAEAFEYIGRQYGETASVIFNYQAGYVAHELYGAAEFIAGGGKPPEAMEMASRGEFENSGVPDENSKMTICPG